MTPTSGSCLRSSKRLRGYTLLEMVVVLALLAMATALAAPAGYRMIQTWRDASEVDRVIDDLRTLGWRARQEGRTFRTAEGGVLEASGDGEAAAGDLQWLVDALPEGWMLRFATPLQVQANGVCHDTELALETDRQSIGLRIQAPYCNVVRQTAVVK